MALCVFLLLTVAFPSEAQDRYQVKFGSVRFHSEPPNEAISAYSSKLSGGIDLRSNSFRFKVLLNSFKGFNCPLLTFLFRANAMETNEYPDASFSGTILDDKDFSKDGEYYVRAKGKLKIHGAEQHVILKVHVTARDGKLAIETSLPVALEDYDVRVPKMFVKEVISQVTVDVAATLVPSGEVSMR